MIVIVDYEIGNLAAIANMLNRLGESCEITANPESVRQAKKLVLPGNGAFDACMQALRATGLIPLLNDKVLIEKTPLLGICVGAQMLGHGSEEGVEPGLGWLNLRVNRLPSLPDLRIPHMGWGDVKKGPAQHWITQDLSDDARFYFVHSYYMEPENPNDVLLTAQHGIDFAAAVGRENICGVQFHPEKSHRFGKHLLSQFAKGQR